MIQTRNTRVRADKLWSYRLWFKDIHAIPNLNAYLWWKSLSQLTGLQRIWTYTLGSKQSSDYHNDSKLSPVFSKKEWFLHPYGMPLFYILTLPKPTLHEKWTLQEAFHLDWKWSYWKYFNELLDRTFPQNQLKWTSNLQPLQRKKRSFWALQTNARTQKKNSGSAKKNYVLQYTKNPRSP